MNSKNLLTLVLGSILALAILISCSSNEESNELSFETIEITQDQLQPFLTFEEDSLVLPFDIAYLSNGNLAVLDFELKSVFIYDKNGEFVSRFGREGKGPGEFVQPVKLQPVDDYIYVLDIAQLNRQKFTQNGKFITTEKPDLGVLTFRDIVAVGEGEFLIPANGKSESLILYKNINNDSTFYFGSAMGDSTITASRAENKKQVINGEVPDLLKNAVLLAHQDDSYYVFLRGYGRIQKYDRSGVLQWEKELKFPFIQELLNAAVENTKELQGGSVSLYTYAFDMDATDNGAYILMNAPQGKNQQLVWINKDGTGGKTYKINYPNSKFTVISVSPSQDQVYFINEPGAQILSLNLSTLK